MRKSVSVSPERLESWLASWAELHGGATTEATGQRVTLTGGDEPPSRVVCEVPFPPMEVRPELAYAGLVEHARRDRTVAVILVRRGGYAVGVFDGRKLVQSKVGSRYVQGKTKAGGSSQQRFARRRDNQARALYEAAADTAVRVVLPYLSRLDAVVLGGDRLGSDQVLRDERLRAVRPLVIERRLLDVPDPKAAVLVRTPASFRAVRIEVVEPDDDGSGEPTVS